MQWLKTLAIKAGLKRKAAVPPLAAGVEAPDPFLIWRSGKKVPAGKAFDVYAGWVYACIRAIAEEIAGMQYRLFQVQSDQSNKELPDHELLEILEAVNSFQTGLELKYLTAAHLEAVGNAYWFLEGVGSEADKPKAIYILNPAKTKAIANRDAFPARVSGYQYQTQNTTYRFAPYQVIHFKYPDPADPFEGIGTVQTTAQWIDADNYAMEFNRRFFLNGARLGGFLESESAYTTEQLEYLKKSFENIFKGVENAYKVAALPRGTKFQAASETQKDMDFANLMTVMRDRILAGFRVPRTVLGITDDVNRANAEATNYVFALRTIQPKMKLIVSYLNEFLVPRYGDDLYLEFADPVPENRELQIQELRTVLAGQPSMSVNEARERFLGLGTIEEGDAVMTDFSKVPLGAPMPKSGQRTSVKQRFGRPTGRRAYRARMRKDVSKCIAGMMINAAREIQLRMVAEKTKSVAALSDDGWEAVWKQFVERVEPYERLFFETIRRMQADQELEVLNNLEDAVKTVDASRLVDLAKWMSVLVNLAHPLAERLTQEEGAAAAVMLGISELDILTPEVKARIKKNLELMSARYNRTTLDELAEKLETGQAQGLSLEELKKIVQEIYAFNEENHAKQAARTETFRLANGATREAWKQSGVVKTVKWYTAADERVCPYCEPMHGTVVDIEKNFFDKGDTVVGTDKTTLTLDYSDIPHPPLHVLCRCYIRPEEIDNS